MSTSGSADLATSGGSICRAAYRIVHSSSSAYTLQPEELVDYLEALNFLVKNLMGPPNYLMRGVKTWQRSTESLTLAAKLEYSFKTSGGDLDVNIPVGIIQANYKQDDTEIPLVKMTYEEYFSISDKTSTGNPTKYQYERRLDEGLFRVNLIPTAAMIANGDTVELAYLTPLEDFDSQANEPFFPQEWYRPLKWLLAQEMSPEAGKRVPPDVAALAKQSSEIANSIDREETSLYFEPDNPELY